jgi:hypothetical protein
MLSHGTVTLKIKITHSLGVLVALAVTAAPVFSWQEAQAGTLAQLQLQSRALRNAPRLEGCGSMARTANCRAA